MKGLKVRKGYPEGKASRIPRLMTYRLVWAPVEIKDDKVLPNTINTLDLITRLSKNVQTCFSVSEKMWCGEPLVVARGACSSIVVWNHQTFP